MNRPLKKAFSEPNLELLYDQKTTQYQMTVVPSFGLTQKSLPRRGFTFKAQGTPACRGTLETPIASSLP